MNALQKLINAAKVKRRAQTNDAYFVDEIATDPKQSNVKGRNGSFDIVALRVDEWGGNSKRVVDINGIGKRGDVIKGGLTVTAECFEEMCRRYLLRGLEKYEYEEEEEKAG